MFMLVNKRPYISCADGVEMWDFEGKKIVNRVTESNSTPITAKEII